MNERQSRDAAGGFTRTRWVSPNAASLAASVGMVAGATLCAHVVRSAIPAPSLALVFLVAVLFSSVTFGFWTGVATAGLAFLAYNFFFVDPVMTLRVTHAEDILALCVFVLVAGLTGLLAGRLREEANAAGRRADLLEQLSRFSNDLGNAGTPEEIERLLSEHLAHIGHAGSVIMAVDGTQTVQRQAVPAGISLSLDDLQAADRALRHQTPELATAAGWSGNRFSFYPLTGSLPCAVVAGVEVESQSPELEQAIASTIEQARAAIDRLRFAGEAAEERLKAERERLRSALLSSLSHDLRTPLATILGSVTSLRQLAGSLPEDAREDLLQAIEEDTRRLTSYVSNLLHMTRLQAGLDLRLDWADPNDILNGAVSQAHKAFPACAITVLPCPQVAPIHTDATLLQQGLFNLIDNALKVSPAGAPVRVSVIREASQILFAVEDEGPGIPASEQTSIFEPFIRGKGASAAGTGLGLAISTGIVQALGGSIRVESPVAGEGGARFRIAVPLKEAGRP